ncbi:carboxypeptidase B-like [Leguminivora glycinivorella]|uniref:carboxypeptidase B-like n=1 Tax=Leguminivora glycinivorella TaxID=1035111 RepID=UPI00200E5637|nr:carboxypeptidase B-like [Leguminivora glycinivorella]
MAKCLVFVIGVLGLGCQVGYGQHKYDNYTLVRLIPNHDQHLQKLSELSLNEAASHGEVEILKRSFGVNDSTDVLVSPRSKQLVEQFAVKNGMPIVTKRDYGRSFEAPQRESRRRFQEGFSVYGYNSFDSINKYLDEVALRKPDLVRLQPLGYSYQRRAMRLAKISKDPSAGNPIIFIDAGIHAREWVAPAMATYIIHRLVTDGRGHELDGVDWYILPVVNPDGYEYTRSSRSQRLWRKTRSKTSHNCYGVDGNRNYGFKWGVSGVSSDPCDRETYAGPKPFSEPETQMVRNVMMENRERIKLYVSLHAYGQYLVYPWGYTGGSLPKTWQKLDSLARKVSKAVQRAGGQPFKVLSAGEWYPAAGGSDDYAFGAIGIPYSYTMELTDGYEFIYPENNLAKILPQLYEGFRIFAEQIKDEFGRS